MTMSAVRVYYRDLARDWLVDAPPARVRAVDLAGLAAITPRDDQLAVMARTADPADPDLAAALEGPVTLGTWTGTAMDWIAAYDAAGPASRAGLRARWGDRG